MAEYNVLYTKLAIFTTAQQPHETHGSPLCNNASFDCYRRTAAELQHFEIKQLFLIHPVYIGLKVKNSLLI